MTEAAVAPESTATSAGAQRVMVASQWQLMWWRFRKHKLAVGGTIVLIGFYLLSLFAGFFAYADPDASDAHRSLIAPQEIHWFDEGRFAPHVYGLKGARDPAAVTEAARLAARRAAQRWSGKKPQTKVVPPR